MRVGVDLIEIERIRRALDRYAGFRERCFTPDERAYCDSRPNPAQSYAGRFAAKEAVGKALGCGVYFTWREIELVGRPKPGVRLTGRTKAWAERVGAGSIDVSMTHSRELAAAICVVQDGTSHHWAAEAPAGRSPAPPPPDATEAAEAAMDSTRRQRGTVSGGAVPSTVPAPDRTASAVPEARGGTGPE